ncbi:MAG: tyrosine-protein phosphatase [Paludibacteraceae bacterium]|nr:tyrosine-protein phosphatase [Paludibacteraceae bacterium]
MKTFLINAGIVVMALSSLAAQASNYSTADKKRCFSENTADKTITFLYCLDSGFWSGSVTSCYVRGSFNGWKSAETCRLAYDSECNCWTVTLPFDYVNQPGNSGQPEYKFYVNGSYKDAPSWLTDGYKFKNGSNNQIVVFSYEDFEQIKKNSEQANVIRSLSSFNFDLDEDRAVVANFRCVPGTKNLYRSYHPYKATDHKNNGNNTEYERLHYVKYLAAANGIKSDICLSENEEKSLTTYTCNSVKCQEVIPVYYTRIIEGKNVLYVNAGKGTPSYNEVYYNSTSSTFGAWVREIVEFIISDSHPAPFQIHCRLGTDRTGVFCGVLAALCGATWDEIAEDYQRSNDMQIREFRDYHLLAYSFRKILDVENMSEVEDLHKSMSEYFVSHGYLTQAQIDALKDKLNDDVERMPVEEDMALGVDDLLLGKARVRKIQTPEGLFIDNGVHSYTLTGGAVR